MFVFYSPTLNKMTGPLGSPSQDSRGGCRYVNRDLPNFFQFEGVFQRVRVAFTRGVRVMFVVPTFKFVLGKILGHF